MAKSLRRVLRQACTTLTLLAAIGAARADEPDYTEEGIPIPSIATLFPGNADLFGNRRWLAERGVTYNFWYRFDVLDNLRGGQRQGAITQGMLESSLSVDFEKLAGLSGLTGYVNAFLIHNTGRIRRDYVGGINTIAAIEADPTFRLSEAWLEQKFFDGSVRVRAGQIAADVSFFYSATSALFLQSDFATLSALNLPSGGPAYPLATPGVMVGWEPLRDVTLLAAVFNGNPAGPAPPEDEQIRNRRGTNFRTQDPALIFAELQVGTNQAPEDTGLARTVKVGGWAHLGGFDSQRYAYNFSSLADPAGPGVPLRRRGNGGIYAVVDQQLYRLEGGDSASGVTAYARIGASPQDRSEIGFYLDGGVVAAGMIPGRPNDAFGLGFIYARFSSGSRAYDADYNAYNGTTMPVRDYEANLEVTYRAEIVPGLNVQPVVTRVWHPNGDPTRNAWVAGFRTILRF
ncbi:carbohydrate porin [Falsiroseomonas sp. HW251]|uniref:carbohydrate porin n=1 Tax=Falsiroseomonas sp. HW251 TaxID=3390998 RepID=UPI003D313359